jgi:hypothetical protein
MALVDDGVIVTPRVAVVQCQYGRGCLLEFVSALDQGAQLEIVRVGQTLQRLQGQDERPALGDALPGDLQLSHGQERLVPVDDRVRLVQSHRVGDVFDVLGRFR